MYLRRKTRVFFLTLLFRLLSLAQELVIADGKEENEGLGLRV